MRTNTDQVLAYFQKNIKLPQEHTAEAQLEKYNQEIAAFVKDQNELMKNLKDFKNYISSIVPMKE